MVKGYRFDRIRISPWYVSHLPGDGGVDWGYTGDNEKAIHLTTYWKRRFAADMKRVGDKACFLESWDDTEEDAA